MANRINEDLPEDKGLAKKVIENNTELERLRLQKGVLGRLWGVKESIPNNIAAVLIILLVLTGITFTFVALSVGKENMPIQVTDFWAIITPLITLAIGYLFGDNLRK